MDITSQDRRRKAHERSRGRRPVEIRQRLIERSVQDEAFRRRLLADPKAVIEEELGERLPEGIEIRAVEETPETVYLVLPPKAAATQGGDELSDRELETVAGGGDPGASKETLPLCTVGEGCWKQLPIYE